MPFAQLVIGPPGAGKSTYCNGMQQFMGAIGRKCSVVNLDPANDMTSYEAAVDVRELVTLESIMGNNDSQGQNKAYNEEEEQDEAPGLGPNGGVLYALEEVEQNFDWLHDRLKDLGDDYVLFDCPGQVELFTHHDSLRKVFMKLAKEAGYRASHLWFHNAALVVVNLVDSYCLTLPSLYVSTLLLCLRSMLQLDMTQLNVLTKIDNLAKYPPLPFNLDFYTEVQDLSYLLPLLEQESPMFARGKFTALNEAIVNLVEEFGLVGFETLAVEDKKSMMTLLHAIDRAGGYAFGAAEGANDTVWQVAVREGGVGKMDVRDVQERWIDQREEWDEIERKQWEEEQRKREEEWKNGQVAGDDGDLQPMMGSSGVKVRRRGEQNIKTTDKPAKADEGKQHGQENKPPPAPQ
ncbi:GPN-loop GTPase 2 [Exophiala dermatitidis]